MPNIQLVGIFIVSKQNNIFLIGLMGAGKTTIGKQLSQRLGKTFYDTDHEVEKRTGVKVSVIFELEGEAGFRKREAGVIKDLALLDDIVLATGGGAVLSEANRQVLQNNGHVIYLRAAVDDLWKRMRWDKQRPLLQNVDIRATLEALYTERHPLYTETANLIVDTGRHPAAVLINQIKKAYLKR
ncbi:MAG TPA: shikimate kinase [Methylophilaceae bacterium]|jgi:shikimate kinase|nr:shikimate kinase [Methylophilaceae bacterium]